MNLYLNYTTDQSLVKINLNGSIVKFEFVVNLQMKCVMYWYFFSKSIELLDTVLMVVRKKNNQITFLHVFHHASMLNIWWWVMMFIPAGSSKYSKFD